MTPAGRRRILLGFSLSFLGLVGAVGLFVAFLLQSAPGQRHVLRTALQVVDRRIQGSLTVEEIRSGGLLGGFTLTGVRLRDPSGAPFLELDSVRVAYTLRGLPSRTLQLEPVAIWAPRVVIETLPGDSLTNVQRIFSGPSEAPEGAGGPPPLDLRMGKVRIYDGRFELRTPTAISIYDGIEAQIRDAELLNRREPGLRIRFDALSGRVQQAGLGEAPFTLDHFEGRLEVVDGRVEVEADDLRLGGSRLEGTLTLALGEAPTLSLDAEVHALRGEDLHWLDARIPALEGGFLVRAEGPFEALTWEVDALELRGVDTRLAGRFGVTLGEVSTFSGVALETRFDLALLEPWLEAPLPVAGQLQGEFQAEGPFRALEVSGRFSFEDRARGIPASEVALTGRLNLEEATTPGLILRADPLRMATLRILGVEAQGTGSAELRVAGGLEAGVTLSGRVTHALQGELTSRVSFEGFANRERMELVATLSPLSFDGVAGALGQELPVVGAISGSLQLVGPFDAVRVMGAVSPLATADEEAQDALRLEATVDLRDPTRSLALEVETEGLDLSRLVRAAPEGSRVSGRLALEARGLVAESLDALDGWVDLELGMSRLGRFELTELRARADAEQGRLYLRELSLRSNLGEVDGEGELALAEGVAPGVTTLHWRLPTFRSLRAFLPEDSPLYPQAGQASGRFELFGGLTDLELRFLAQGASVELTGGTLQGVSLQGTTRLFEGALSQIEAVATLQEPKWDRFTLRQALLEAEGTLDALLLSLDLAGSAGEQYRLSGLLEPKLEAFRLETLELGLDRDVWRLLAPTQLSWAEGVYRVEPLELQRPPMRMAMAGFFDPSGEVDLRVESVAVDVSRVARLLQLEATPEGMLDLSFTLRGPSQSPRAEGQFLLFEAGFGETRFSRIAGEIQAADRMANLALSADQGGRLALRAVGQYPVDLALGAVEARFPALPVSLDLTVTQLSAQTLLAPLEALEDVRGTLSGEIQVRGEPEALLPSGSLRLVDGSFALPEIGLVPDRIQATFTLTRDRVLQVVAEGRSGGPLRLTGEVALSDLLNPELNLRLEADRMQAVARRDIDARVSGIVDLTGSYMRPRVTGNIRVDQANLFLEEFARTAEVVDLSDPAFRDVVDTTLAAARPILRAASNPFLENLRVDADLSMQRDVWLRSREMNVEIGGNLVVTFDRSRREVLLVGTVAAIRGSYNAFGKAFQVRGGTVDFVGTPGINPTLSVEAVHRLRQPGGEPLDIVAQLEGTLLGLRISLRSDASVAISEADLISYLVFGRPSYALASAESRMLGDAAISAGIGAATGQISTLVGQRIGLDYFTITQAQDAGPGVAAVTGQGLADTQVELGQYVLDDVFLALVLRPLRGIGGSQAQIPGARVEWRLTDRWTFNAYVEDRFGREGIYSFGDGGLRVNRIFGLEIFREWGY